MFTSTIVYTRPNSSVAFYKDSSVEAATLVDRIDLALAQSPGFVNKAEGLTADRLTLTTAYMWESKEANLAFLATNKTLLDEIKVSRNAYCSAKGISRTVS